MASHSQQNRNVSSIRGLAASGDAGVRRIDSYRADPRVLEIEPGFNIRIGGDPELRAHIDSIKQSIRDYITKDDPENRVCKGGLQEVIPALLIRLTEDGHMVIVDGHCRTTAIRELIAEGFDIQEVDIDVTRGDEADRVLIMVRSSQGKNLEPIEKAKAFVRFADQFNWSFPEISKACGGISTQRVEQLVLLGRSPQVIRDLVAEKKVTADSAIEIIRKYRETPDEAVRVLQELVASKGARPVGKGQTRVSIPRKAQDAVFEAFSKNKSLNKQLKAIGNKDGWEEMEVQVSLPAGVVKQLLELQAKGSAAGGDS